MTTTIMIAAGWAIALAVVGGLTTPLTPWYRQLAKPTWQPPDWAFGPAWSLILACAAAAGVLAWDAAATAGEQRRVLVLAGVNSAAFLAWSPLFFVLRRPDWALGEVFVLLGSIVAAIVGIWPISHVASLLLLPYLAWVSFAAVLNHAIVTLNADPAARGAAVAGR